MDVPSILLLALEMDIPASPADVGQITMTPSYALCKMPSLTGPTKGHTRVVYLTVTIDIDTTPEKIWPHLVDWEQLPAWMQEASDVTVIGSLREGVGVQAEARVRIAGLSTRDRIRVTRWEPPAILELAHLGWVKGSGYIELTPLARGTHVFWREELIPPWGIVGSLGLRVLAPVMRRVFARDLRRLRELVESAR
jgi:uncharacterized protein YndB with AHSA1/START domain